MADNRWISLRTPNFHLLSQSDEKQGREAIKLFEEVRLAFTGTLGLKLPENKPITIVSFRDAGAFARYKPRPNILAYTFTARNRDYIVMQELTTANYPYALHEFTHVMVAQAGIKLPLWLNEGFAEIYGTLIPDGRRIRVGRIIPARLQTVQSAMLDLHEVLSADRNSKLYNEADRVGIFYAESWALVHMLKFSDAYAPRFELALDAIGRGESSEEALQKVYSKSLGQILTDLGSYVHGSRFREGVIKTRLDQKVAEPQLETVDPVQTGVLLATLEARSTGNAQAITSLQELMTENPQRLEPVETLAWIQLNGAAPVAAIAPFRRALQMGTRDATLCYEFAVKLNTVIPDSDYVAALHRAAEIDPGLAPAQEQLAAHAFNHHDYPETLARLHAIKKLERSNAFPYWQMLSAASLQTGNIQEAKSAAANAAKYAVTADEKRRLEELQKLLSAR